MPQSRATTLEFEVDGRVVEVPDDGSSLLEVLRERLGLRSPKDGCSPQGQCGCCTVLVEGQPRVACVTPARRVRGRTITTLDGLDPERRQAWADAFCAAGASQCGFCTPGIILRLEGLRAKGTDLGDPSRVGQALLAHLCRCTGWRSIVGAAAAAGAPVPDAAVAGPAPVRGGPTRRTGASAANRQDRDLAAAARRAEVEGRSPQRIGPGVALGQAGFADDLAPDDALVAVPNPAGGWAVGETLAAARAASGKVQGRRTTAEIVHPLDVPPGNWLATLRTTWVEPAYLELDASWCRPGGTPASPLANGGAFGGKRDSEVGAIARRLADEHGRPVRVVLSREDAVRRGPKRPPVAGGMRADGTGVLRVVRTPGVAEAVAAVAPGLVVEEIDVPGPPTSTAIRAAGWAEALVLLAATGVTPPTAAAPGILTAEVVGPAGGPGEPDTVRDPGDPAGPGGTTGTTGIVGLRSPDGAEAHAEVALGDGARVRVRIRCGEVLDEVVLRSYCMGAAHMALGWACSEAIAVDAAGEVHDLTIRSFGILRAADTPPIEVEVLPDDGPPVNGSDAVFAAVAAATWLAQGRPATWPTGGLPGAAYPVVPPTAPATA